MVLLVLLPTLAAAVGAALFERQALRAVGSTLTWTIDRGHHGDDVAALRSLLASDATEQGQWREALDARGAVIAEGGDAGARATLMPPTTVATAGKGRVAAVRIRATAHGVIAATAATAALSLAAGLGWGWATRRTTATPRPSRRRLRSVAVSDALTGLLNRAGLARELQRGLDAGNMSPSRRLGVLLIDLDRFRLINESFGQQVGDQLLRDVAKRIRGVLRPGDLAARLGNDQFAVCASALAGEQAATVMARNLSRALGSALVVGDRQTQVSASIGIALADAQTSTPDSLLAQAEAALRAAKSGGGARYRLFEPSMLTNTQLLLELDMALRHALAQQEFELAFQPIFTAEGRSIIMVEALLRWNCPGRGSVVPAEFIPVLEQTGLIVPVGNWVLREACRRVQSWTSQGAQPVMVSVNVSPIQFAEGRFVQQVLDVLQATGLPAHRLQLEVTEGLLLDPTDEALRKMDALVDAGVRLAVDDFGMGYSSLAYLKRFRLHALKIDRMFVRDVPQQPRDAAIVRAIVDLAHALELQVTAEGVETDDQHRALRALGCDAMQGYLFARPMPADLVLERLLPASTRALDESTRDWSTTMAAQFDPGIRAPFRSSALEG